MSEWFRRLPGTRRTPAGMERRILRSLPRVLAYGAVLLMLPSLLARLAGEAGTVMTTDMLVAGLLFLHLNAVLAVGIGAFIVMVMKGTAYVADAHSMEDGVGAGEDGAR